VSAWAAVLDEVAAVGGTPGQVAARLGLPTSLVQAVLVHAERLGVVSVAGSGCAGPGSSVCHAGPDVPPACAGCPLALP
jgi:hypothetical protein